MKGEEYEGVGIHRQALNEEKRNQRQKKEKKKKKGKKEKGTLFSFYFYFIFSTFYWKGCNPNQIQKLYYNFLKLNLS